MGGANGRLPGYAMHDHGELNYLYPNIGKAFLQMFLGIYSPTDSLRKTSVSPRSSPMGTFRAQ